jgi:LysR family glycine cleavage system transcriptional activator
MTLRVKHLPSLFALRAFEAAVRHRSYSAAARELTVTQGAVSQQIRRLEAEFGARLFDRVGNEMTPTADAQRLAGEVASALARLRAAVVEFTATADTDPLVLSLTYSFGSRWLGPRLPRLLEHPAGTGLDIRVEDRIANFATDGVDVGVRAGRGDWEGLETQRLTVERLCVVCSPDFAARHPITGLRDLQGVPLIHSHERLWRLLFEPHHLATPPASGLIANDTVLVLDAVSRGLGAALVRYSMVAEDLRTGRLVRPVRDTVELPVNFIRPGRLVRPVRAGDAPPADIGYFLVWRADTRKLRRIHALRDWLLAEARAEAAELEALSPG